MLWTLFNHLLTHVILVRVLCGPNIRTYVEILHHANVHQSAPIESPFYAHKSCTITYQGFQLWSPLKSFTNACHSCQSGMWLQYTIRT